MLINLSTGPGRLRGFGGFGAFGLATFEVPAPSSGGWDRGDEFRQYRARRDAALSLAQTVLDAAGKVPPGVPGADRLQAVLDQARADLGNEAGLIDRNWPWDVGWPVNFTRSPGRTAALLSHLGYYTDALERLANEGRAALDEIDRLVRESQAAQAAQKKAQADAIDKAAREAAIAAVQAAIAAGAKPGQVEAAGRAAAGAVKGYATPTLAVGEGILPTWAKAALIGVVGVGGAWLILRPKRA